MTKKEINLKGLELVAYAGDARACYLKVLNHIKKNEFDKIQILLDEADELVIEAHKAQTELLQMEASGNYSDITLIMVHGQDHLMTTILLKELMSTLIYLAKK